MTLYNINVVIFQNRYSRTDTLEQLGFFFAIFVFLANFLRSILAPPNLKSYALCPSRKSNFFEITQNFLTMFHLGKINIFHFFSTSWHSIKLKLLLRIPLVNEVNWQRCQLDYLIFSGNGCCDQIQVSKGMWPSNVFFFQRSLLVQILTPWKEVTPLLHAIYESWGFRISYHCSVINHIFKKAT